MNDRRPSDPSPASREPRTRRLDAPDDEAPGLEVWQALAGLEEAVPHLLGDRASEAAGALASFAGDLERAAQSAGLAELVWCAHDLGRLARSVAAPPPPNRQQRAREAARLVRGAVRSAAEAEERRRSQPARPGEVDLALDVFRFQDPEALAVFHPEAEEHVRGVTRCLERLRRAPHDPDLLREAFRRAHTVKGAAYTVGCPSIGDVARGLEDLLGAASREELSLDPEGSVELCLEAADLLVAMLGRLGGRAGPPLQARFERALGALAGARPRPSGV
ncbi:MAG: Hpt domain-containing protein [Acidobacteriota bacterium]